MVTLSFKNWEQGFDERGEKGCVGRWGDVCHLGPSPFKNAYACILTLIIWVQLRHTQCMLVNKLLAKQRATVMSKLSHKAKNKILKITFLKTPHK